MKTRYLFVLAIFVTILTASRVAAETLLLGTLNHPQIAKYESIVQHAYADIGVNVEYISTAVERRLISSNDGLLDGLVVAATDVNKQYKKLIIVEPPLSNVTIFLLCLKQEPCDKSLLFSSEISIITEPRALTMLERSFQKEILAKVIEVQRLGVVIELLKHKRAKYATFTLDDTQSIPAEVLLNTNRVPLHTIELHHFLHQKHSHLIPKLAASIERQLELTQQ
ncbi:MAG: hypothetical protein HWE10_07565 [Gammaproteobacteria bacterium]|nr:hypothetical protein [Gammaproteobacteria bacterium]